MKTLDSIFGILAFIAMIIFILLFINTSNNTFGIWFIIMWIFFKQCYENAEK